MANIFLLGATGYIGGDALYALEKCHPEYEITCLVRNSDKGALVTKAHPKVRLVYGDLDSVDLLAQESARANIVLHFANCDHEASAKAIVKGISSRSTPGYYIHTSGTGILTVNDVKAGREGLESDQVYDDWENVSKVTSLPDDAWHRKVDQIVLAAPSNVNTAIVCPPTIYGAGRGPGNTVSDQCPYMANGFIKISHAFQVGEGKNRWTQVHVHDLSALYLLLVEAAAAGGGKATWNEEGYYFAENGEFFWGDIAKEIAREVKKQGYMESDELLSYDVEKANTITPYGGMKWGFNSRCRAIRARKLLGWQPKGAPLLSEIPDLVRVEALKLGVAKTHAQKAAGDV